MKALSQDGVCLTKSNDFIFCLISITATPQNMLLKYIHIELISGSVWKIPYCSSHTFDYWCGFKTKQNSTCKPCRVCTNKHDCTKHSGFTKKLKTQSLKDKTGEDRHKLSSVKEADSRKPFSSVTSNTESAWCNVTSFPVLYLCCDYWWEFSRLGESLNLRLEASLQLG